MTVVTSNSFKLLVRLEVGCRCHPLYKVVSRTMKGDIIHLFRWVCPYWSNDSALFCADRARRGLAWLGCFHCGSAQLSLARFRWHRLAKFGPAQFVRIFSRYGSRRQECGPGLNTTESFVPPHGDQVVSGSWFFFWLRQCVAY